MAIVQLKQVEVVKVFGTGYGVQVAEKFTVKGAEREKRFTVWFEEAHGLREGDRIDVSGFLNVAVEPWEDRDGKTRHSAKVSLNKPRLDRNEALTPTSPAAEPWAADSEVPF